MIVPLIYCSTSLQAYKFINFSGISVVIVVIKSFFYFFTCQAHFLFLLCEFEIWRPFGYNQIRLSK